MGVVTEVQKGLVIRISSLLMELEFPEGFHLCWKHTDHWADVVAHGRDLDCMVAVRAFDSHLHRSHVLLSKTTWVI